TRYPRLAISKHNLPFPQGISSRCEPAAHLRLAVRKSASALVCSGEIAFRHKSSARPWKKFSYQFDGIVTILLFSLLRLFQRRQYGNEVFGEAPAIIFQQLADAFVTGGSNDQPYVMFLF